MAPGVPGERHGSAHVRRSSQVRLLGQSLQQQRWGRTSSVQAGCASSSLAKGPPPLQPAVACSVHAAGSHAALYQPTHTSQRAALSKQRCQRCCERRLCIWAALQRLHRPAQCAAARSRQHSRSLFFPLLRCLACPPPSLPPPHAAARCGLWWARRRAWRRPRTPPPPP